MQGWFCWTRSVAIRRCFKAALVGFISPRWGLQIPVSLIRQFGRKIVGGPINHTAVLLNLIRRRPVMFWGAAETFNSSHWGLQSPIGVFGRFGRKMVGGPTECASVFELWLLLCGASVENAGIWLKSSSRRIEWDWFRMIWWSDGRDFELNWERRGETIAPKVTVKNVRYHGWKA